MTDMIAAYAEAIGEKPAIVDDRPGGEVRTWIYAELNDNATRLANVFAGLGVKAGDKVLSCGGNSPWLVGALLASRRLGAVLVPLNYRLTPTEAAYIVNNSDAQLVMIDAEYAELFQNIADDTPQVQHRLVFDGEVEGFLSTGHLVEQASADPLPEAPGEGSSMIYTSGTTGNPKGVYRQNSGSVEQQMRLVELLGYSSDDVYITTGPLYHSGPLGFLNIGMGMGNTIVLQNKFSPEDWLRLVDTYRVSSTFAAPTPIRRLCQLEAAVAQQYDVSSMRCMVANAAPWSQALKQMYVQRFPQESLYEVYGSTELGVSSVLLPEDQFRKPGSCGKPAPGVEIVLVDENGSEVTEPRTEGELFVRSASVFTTYYKAQEKFEEERRGDLQTVGDIAYFDEEGYYFICDRKKDMIISGGMNIYPAEIEAVLDQHSDIMDVAVFGIPNEEWGESVHALVVARSGSGLDAEAVTAFAREHLTGYKTPRSVDFVDDIPRTGSGKILKRQLREPYWRDYNTRV